MEVEWLILADSAQVLGNKLYLLGGGWDLLTVNREFPVQQQMAISASFRVPWPETNTKHNVQLEIQDDDGHSIARVDGQLEVGRPPGIPVGSEQRSQLALQVSLKIEKPGIYPIISRIEGEEKARTFFRVVGGRSLNVPGLSGPAN